METPFSFGLWLRQRRKALDLTRESLAQCVGYSVSAIRKIEDDERRPSRQVAELLANCLDIDLADRPAFLKAARAELSVDRLANIKMPNVGTLSVKASSPPQPAPPPPRSPAGRSALGSPLPIPPTPLLGREHELTSLAQLLQNPECRLLTLTGPGGIGKTRLAIETALRQQETSALSGDEGLTDGIYFVSLAPVSRSELIVPAMAGALGFAFYGSADPQVQLLNYLGEKRLLLVLDNFEHLLASPEADGESGVELLNQILRYAPAVKLLVTSRERLNLYGEWIFELHGLPVPQSDSPAELESYSAAALFLQSAQRAQLGFKLTTEDWPAVARICQLVDGLPLGLELAASWVRVLSCREIAQEIERNLDFLSISARNVPERHRSMRALFDHSWQLMTEEERSALMELSVFRGGFDRAAAQQVAQASLALLSALLSKSLIHRAEAGRYDLHELVRQYAADRLKANPGLYDRIQQAHSQYFSALLQANQKLMRSEREIESLTALEPEIDNIRVSLQWAITQHHLGVLGSSTRTLYHLFNAKSWFQEGVHLFAQIAEMLEAELVAGKTAGSPPAEASIEDISSLLAQSLTYQGVFYFRTRQQSQAIALLSRAEAMFRPLNNGGDLAEVLSWLGRCYFQRGNYAEALTRLQEAVSLAEAVGDKWVTAFALNNKALLARTLGDATQGLELMRRAVALARESGDAGFLAILLGHLGGFYVEAGDRAQAQIVLQEGIALSRVSGSHLGLILNLRHMAILAEIRADYTGAKDLLKESLAEATALQEQFHRTQVLLQLGYLALKMEDEMGAGAAFREVLKVAWEAQLVPSALDGFVGLAELYLRQGQPTQAAELVAFALNHEVAPQPTKNRAGQLQTEVAARLSPPQLEAAQARAQARSFEVIVAEILAS